MSSMDLTFLDIPCMFRELSFREPFMESNATSPRTSGGRFAPGHSGNPAGRPKGTRGGMNLLAEVLEEGELEALLRQVVRLALGGDRAMLRFCAIRLLPPPKGRTIAFDLPEGAEGDREAIAAGMVRAVAEGAMTPDEAVTVGRFLQLIDRAARGARRPLSDLSAKAPARAMPQAAAEAQRSPAAAPSAAPAPAATCYSPVPEAPRADR